MNIFALDNDPRTAALGLCDQHVNKMLVESCQLLSNALPESRAPYKRTHYNHPCSKWVRASANNYCWLLEHAWELAIRFYAARGRAHRCEHILREYLSHSPRLVFARRTPFALACGEYNDAHADPVECYRAYYRAKLEHWQTREDKRRIIPTWTEPAIKPDSI